jgi:hypothetical protein
MVKIWIQIARRRCPWLQCNHEASLGTMEECPYYSTRWLHEDLEIAEL